MMNMNPYYQESNVIIETSLFGRWHKRPTRLVVGQTYTIERIRAFDTIQQLIARASPKECTFSYHYGRKLHDYDYMAIPFNTRWVDWVPAEKIEPPPPLKAGEQKRFGLIKQTRVKVLA